MSVSGFALLFLIGIAAGLTVTTLAINNADAKLAARSRKPKQGQR